MADPKVLKKEECGRQFISAVDPHLSQMRTTKYRPMPFTRKSGFLEKYGPIGRGGVRPTAPPPLNPPLLPNTGNK